MLGVLQQSCHSYYMIILYLNLTKTYRLSHNSCRSTENALWHHNICLCVTCLYTHTHMKMGRLHRVGYNSIFINIQTLRELWAEMIDMTHIVFYRMSLPQSTITYSRSVQIRHIKKSKATQQRRGPRPHTNMFLCDMIVLRTLTPKEFSKVLYIIYLMRWMLCFTRITYQESAINNKEITIISHFENLLILL